MTGITMRDRVGGSSPCGTMLLFRPFVADDAYNRRRYAPERLRRDTSGLV